MCQAPPEVPGTWEITTQGRRIPSREPRIRNSRLGSFMRRQVGCSVGLDGKMMPTCAKHILSMEDWGYIAANLPYN